MARGRRLLLLGLLSACGGCRAAQQIRDPDYPPVTWDIHQSYHTATSPEAALAPVVPELAGQHSVEEYIQLALNQNAGVQAARKRLEAAAMRVPQAASLQDPMISANGWPFYPYVPQTAAGRVVSDITVSQEVPWKGKLQAASRAAEAEVDMARARLASTELQVIAEVKQAYYQLYFVEESLRITKESRELLNQVLQVAEVRYASGKTSQQDILRLQAELSNIDADIVRLGQELMSSQAELAQLLHISPETAFATTGQLDLQRVPDNLESLYTQAVTARPELHEQLAQIRRDRFQVDRARLNYYPDVTYGALWSAMTKNRALAQTADGLDMVGFNVSANLPVYRNRIRAGVRESEATVVASAREYDQLKDQTLRDVKSLFAESRSQQDIIVLFRESIIPKTEQALEISMSEYQVGTVEFVQVVDNWRSLLRLQLMLKQTESQLEQTLASLEQTVGGFVVTPAEPIPAPASEPIPSADEPLSENRN